jgi:Putative auto-transporter adhesin, head GIN domain
MLKRPVLKRIVLPAALIALPVAAIVIPAWADTKSYSLANFEEINVSAGIEVELVQGPYSVKVESPQNDFDKIIVEVRGKTLRIGRKNNNWFSRGPEYFVTVSAPAYTGIDASSGSHVDGDNLSLKGLNVDVSSGAHIELSGACSDLSVDISSGAHFDGENLKCESARVDASSGAHAEAYATRSASGDASSGANVTFRGKPATLEKETSSGGSVKSL